MASFRLLLLTTSVVGAVLSGVVVAAPQASAVVSYPLDPSRDSAIPAGAYSAACNDHPAGRICENVFIRALNAGRAKLDAPAYTLPKRFHSLAGPDQLLVLSNRDRRLYGRAPISGRNPTLTTSAQRGAVSGSDPAFVSVGGRPLTHGGSNWAGGTRSPLFAYFLWMYADQGSDWIHRHNVLMQTGGDVLIMGVGSTHSGYPSWTTLFESFTPGTLIELVPTVLLLTKSILNRSDPTARIVGLGFVHVRAVTFDGAPASFERVSAGLLRVTPPPHEPGRVHVQVVTRGGVSRLTAAAAYTY